MRTLLVLAVLLASDVAEAACYGEWDAPEAKRYSAVIVKLWADAKQPKGSSDNTVKEARAIQAALVTLASDHKILRELITARRGALLRLDVLEKRFPPGSQPEKAVERSRSDATAALVELERQVSAVEALQPAELAAVDLEQSPAEIAAAHFEAWHFLEQTNLGYPSGSPLLGFYGQGLQRHFVDGVYDDLPAASQVRCKGDGSTLVWELIFGGDMLAQWRLLAGGLGLEDFVTLASRVHRIDTEQLEVSCLDHSTAPSLTFLPGAKVVRVVSVARRTCFDHKPLFARGYSPKLTHLEVPEVEWTRLRATIVAKPR